MKEIKTMTDGTIAVITYSKLYYVRRMYKWKSYSWKSKGYKKYDRIEYYSLHWKYIPLASAECEYCWEIIQSQMCWDFVTCKCWSTSVDTDRWFPERHRILTK